MQATTKNWKRVVAAKIAAMTPAEAAAKLLAINEESRVAGPTIFHATIRDITGGLNSQNINFAVIRKLADRAKAAV